MERKYMYMSDECTCIHLKTGVELHEDLGLENQKVHLEYFKD